MAPPPPPLLLLLLLAVVATRCAVARVFYGDDVDDGGRKTALRPLVISCSTAGNYTDGSQYHVNLYNLLSAIPMTAANNGGFFNGTSGAAGDQVFGLFMCYTGNSDSECVDCLTRAPEGIMQLCPHSRKVRALYNACTLRYSDEPFFSVADLTIVYPEQRTTPLGNLYDSVLVGNVVDTTGMSSTRFELVHQLTARASQSAMRIAEDNQQFTDTQWVGAVAQCTRDLPPSECTRCLSYYTDQLPRLFPNNSGGAIKGYSCYLGYTLLRRHLEWYRDLERNRMWEQERASSKRRKRRQLVHIIVGVVVGTVALVLCLIGLSVFFLSYRQRRRNATAVRSELEQPLKDSAYFRGKSVDQDELEQGIGPRRFTYDELVLATDGFSDEHKLGEGGFGSVYRGFLADANLHIAVKQVSKSSRQGWKEFVSEVRIISRLRHQNLVQLLGWFHGGDDDLLLVYELMPHGSLDSHL